MAESRDVESGGEDTVTLSDLDSGGPAGGTTLPDGHPSGRYELREEIARGGMGVVHLADDRRLGRPVAVKILQGRYKPGSAVARRFVDEARISGQLQHPGIPPIHDLGTLPDGRPFLAMKLIKGRTLDDLLAGRPNPEVDRGRFLAAFEQVCQAVAYAHARRVIHRDLKPENIMVGAFGEVQVMDWGLAKVLGREPEPAQPTDSDERLATEIFSGRDDSDGSETQAGSVLGTPAYMAPEQAAGAVEQVDERSDVFGLGAVLAVILTGRPPYVGETAESTRVLAARGKLDDCFARLDACGAGPELVALCKSCLSPERDDRPGDAGAIARAVASFRAEAEERARQAELDRVRAEGERARLEAETRALRLKRRAQLAVTVGALALLVVGAGAWLTVRNQAEARRNDADRLASVALGRAEQLEAQAGAIDPEGLFDANAALELWEQAEAAMAQAEEAISKVGGAAVKARVRERASSIRSGLAKGRRAATLLAALEAAAGSDSGTVGMYHDQRAKSLLYRSAFEEAGLPARGSAATLAAAIRGERPGLRAALLRGLDNWSDSLRRPPDPDEARVRATADLVEADPTRKEIRAVIAGNDKAALSRLAGRLTGADLPPATAVILGTAFGDHNLYEEAVRVLRPARDRDPSDPRLLAKLSWSLRMAYPKNPVAIEESVGCGRMMVAIHPNNAYSHYVLGQAFSMGKNDLASAERHYLKTLELNPKFAHVMNNLGSIQERKGDPAAAESWYRKAARTDPNFARPRDNLAALLAARGDFAGAESEYRTVLALDPNYSSARKSLALVQRFALLLPRLDGVLAGRASPSSPSEAADFAELCRKPFLRRYAAAIRLFEQAFDGDPEQARKMTATTALSRYNAATTAVLAGSGQGNDAPTDPAGRAALRGQALAWLRALLVSASDEVTSDNPANRKYMADRLGYWIGDNDLASVRPGDPKCDLPADERPAWESLWADVRKTLGAARKPVPAAKPAPKP